MGSPSRLTTDAFMTICSGLQHSTPWLYLQNTDPLSPFQVVIILLSVPAAFAIYKHTRTSPQLPHTPIQQSNEFALALPESLSTQSSLISQDERLPSSVSTSTSDLIQIIPETPCPTREPQLRRSSTDAWERLNGHHEETNPSTPLALPSPNEQWSPQFSRGHSDSTNSLNSTHIHSPQVHIYCTHVEQKISKTGLVSSTTRPSFHVPVAHFPQLQTTFSASSERAFFNSQQELSASPIVRDARYLDIQYRLLASVSGQAPNEVNFDEIIATIRRNKKANRDTNVYIQVTRVKDIVPCVLLAYVYHGQQYRSVISTISSYFGEEIPQCTKIIDFRAHLIRVKHLSANTLLWDCARHIVKSVKHDHGIILQTRDLSIEIFGQDQNSGGLQHFKMNSSETIRTFMRDSLPGLLQRNGNVVHLQVSAYKKT